MKFEILTALRDRLQQDPAVNDYAVDRYGRAPTHWIGLHKPRGAQDCPAVMYVPVREQRLNDERLQTVSLVLAVNQQAVEDGVYHGVEEVAALAELVETALFANRALAPAVIVQAGSETFTDLGASHPFYRLELRVEVAWVDLPVEEGTLLKHVTTEDEFERTETIRHPDGSTTYEEFPP